MDEGFQTSVGTEERSKKVTKDLTVKSKSRGGNPKVGIWCLLLINIAAIIRLCKDHGLVGFCSSGGVVRLISDSPAAIQS